MKKFGEFIALILLAVPVDLFTSLVISKFWVWFVMPIFSIGAITVLQAFGLLLLVALLSSKGQKEELDFEESIGKILGIFIASLVFLLIGWILTLFL